MRALSWAPWPARPLPGCVAPWAWRRRTIRLRWAPGAPTCSSSAPPRARPASSCRELAAGMGLWAKGDPRGETMVGARRDGGWEWRERVAAASWDRERFWCPGQGRRAQRETPQPGLDSELFPPPRSHDQRFFLKTQRRREVQVLLAHLPRYVQHLQRHPHSLLARLLGVHSLRVAQGKKKYFIIMQSVFYPAGRISERYDIKGCEVSRWVEPAPEGSPLVLVLKDLNFQGKTMNLGPQRSWLLRQMELDTTFLQELRVLDYSLLMAFQRLHDDERGQSGSVIFLVARSVHGAQIPEEAGSQNRRLLPDGPNALHVLDGPEHRYFLGLVDLATVYGLRKRLEHLWKTLRYPGRTFSTVSPACYARRLCQWVEAHTE
ncbi:PREDICTED: phosphatidylinositol 4-phosphate 5-kinase-like protein 1 isoform X6 [Chinchilla lanigera]|uniref:phosphatidylinositol 4-phosphate 5-kinase-like protein 1 isoform X6 n=1 Tax=Chinchilla lanigera TaxID=34839 RepID=UPI00038F01B5|nr:PREDICTED: phosphatidylinositol 4-phosphate 5-kinase-like protein 1 isoform X6 [Chinchilla lanigera]